MARVCLLQVGVSSLEVLFTVCIAVVVVGFMSATFFYFVGLSQKKKINPMQLQRNAATMVWFFFHLKLPTDIALQCNKQFVVL